MKQNTAYITNKTAYNKKTLQLIKQNLRKTNKPLGITNKHSV